MNSIDLSPLYRSSIGFDRMASLLSNAMSTDSGASNYPPYNIEVVEDNQYAITLAVAGFSQEDLDIQIEKGVLVVRGNKSSNDKPNYLHQGIVSGAFERKFSLADHVEVTDAALTNGMLTINLVREVPEAMKPKSIAINGAQVLEHKNKGKSPAKGSKAA